MDEPVVTFYVQAGYQLKTERRYLTLAELVSESAADRTALIPMPVPSVAPFRSSVLPPLDTVASSAHAAAPKPARSGRRNSTGAPASPVQADVGNVSSDGVAPTAELPRPRDAGSASQAAAAVKAGLKLEPLDFVLERNPKLKASAELILIPAASPQERTAACALCRVLSVQLQDILRDNEKLQAIENSVSSVCGHSRKPCFTLMT